MKKIITSTLVLSALAFAPVSAFAESTKARNNQDDNRQYKYSETCPNGGVRPQDGTGMKNGAKKNGQKQNKYNYENCTQENCDCPNDGVRPLDGTGLRKGAKS